MELLTTLAWGTLVLIHASPAAVLVSPGLLRRLYGVAPDGDLGVLLTHRGALFLAVIVTCVSALLDPGVRRTASLVTAVSVIGFLIVYARAGWPAGALRPIALADLAALAPLALVTVQAWRAHTP